MNNIALKSPTESPWRKHGRNALHRRAKLVSETDTRQAPAPQARVKTSLTFRSEQQAYLWVTDRGRSRMIKH